MKQRKQIIALVVLLVVAGAVWYREKNDTASPSGTAFVAQNYQLLSIENPQIRWQKLEASRKTEYKSSGRNPFSKIAAPTAAVIAAAKARDPYVIRTVPVDPPIPPLQPPPGLKFFGYGTVPNGTMRLAFLTDGEEVQIVSEGQTLQGRYRIVKINNTNLEFEELSSGRRATMPLVEEPVAGGGPT
jgi:hypothetical protein